MSDWKSYTVNMCTNFHVLDFMGAFSRLSQSLVTSNDHDGSNLAMKVTLTVMKLNLLLDKCIEEKNPFKCSHRHILGP